MDLIYNVKSDKLIPTYSAKDGMPKLKQQLCFVMNQNLKIPNGIIKKKNKNIEMGVRIVNLYYQLT